MAPASAVVLLRLLVGCDASPTERQADGRGRQFSPQRSSKELPENEVENLRAMLVPGSTRESVEWASTLRSGPVTFQGIFGFGFELSVYSEGSCAAANPHRVLWLEVDPEVLEGALGDGPRHRDAAEGEIWMTASGRGRISLGPAGHLGLYPGVLRVERIERAECCVAGGCRGSDLGPGVFVQGSGPG